MKDVITREVLGYKGKSGAVTQGKRALDFFLHTRNAKILIIRYTANVVEV